MNKREFILITKSDYFHVKAGDVCIITDSKTDYKNGVLARKINETYELYHSKDSFKRITLTELEEVIYGIKAN